MWTLSLFGAPVIEGPGGPVAGRATTSRRVALLAILALGRGRPATRDRIVALLWPDAPTDRARAQLSDAIYIIRGALGADAILTTADDVVLNTAVITTDIEAFERLAGEGRLEEAADVRTGPLLDGFHVPDAGEFERWLDGERARVDHLYVAALEDLAQACEAQRDFAAAVKWWRRLALHDPWSSRIAVCLMQALEETGDRSGALRHASVHTALVRDEFDADADPAVDALAERLRRAPERPAEDARGAHAARVVVAAPPSRRENEHVAATRPKPRVAHAARVQALVAGTLVLLLVAGVLAMRRFRDAAPPAPLARSVAVLPFLNISGEPENLYFSDGLTEQIIAALSRVEGLQVAARTSSFALRDRSMDVRAIGDTLGVAAILEGSVRRDGDRLRVTAQLIDARTGYHIWSDDFDRELRDVIALQDEIAREIAVALDLHLMPDNGAMVARRVVDMEAYDLYLRGLHLRSDLTGESLRQAATYFDRAIALQPDFALAYAGKASVVGPLITFGHIPFDEGLAQFHALTTRALELDPSLGEAHVALGLIRLFFEWDWGGAGEALRKAIDLNPSDAHAHHHLANWLRVMGHIDDAIAARKRAVALDPLNARTLLLIGTDYAVAGDVESALVALRRGIELDPVNALALGGGPWLPIGPGEAFRIFGRDREAVQDYIRVAKLRNASDDDIEKLRRSFETAGMSGFWRSWLDMDMRQSGGTIDPLRAATLWSLIGDTTRTLDWLERAHRERNPGLINLRIEPAFEPFRSHPRFISILEAMNFPPL